MDLCKTVLTGARADVLDPQLGDDLGDGVARDLFGLTGVTRP